MRILRAKMTFQTKSDADVDVMVQVMRIVSELVRSGVVGENDSIAYNTDDGMLTLVFIEGCGGNGQAEDI